MHIKLVQSHPPTPLIFLSLNSIYDNNNNNNNNNIIIIVIIIIIIIIVIIKTIIRITDNNNDNIKQFSSLYSQHFFMAKTDDQLISIYLKTFFFY